MNNGTSVFNRIPFTDRVFYFYESFDGDAARVHKDKVGVIDFRNELMAESCVHFIRQFNNTIGISFIRATRCGKYVVLVDITKVKGRYTWHFK
jgi:hypothetical protein